jgi:hypothetical protein
MAEGEGDVVDLVPDAGDSGSAAAGALAPNAASEPAAAGEKRGRLPQLEVCARNLATAKETLLKRESDLEKSNAATGYDKTAAKRSEDIAKATAKVAKAKAAVAELEEKHAMIIEAQETRKQAEEVKRQRKLEDENSKRDWSTAGAMALASGRVSLEASFASRKAKNDKSWEQLLDMLTAQSSRGEFPASDIAGPGGIERLKRKWSQMEADYRWYAKQVQRYKFSGAPREDIDNIPRK